MMTTTPISRSEREDLRRLINQREKVLKSAAKQRSAELLANFENQMGSQFSFDDDSVWQGSNLAVFRRRGPSRNKRRASS